MVVCGFGPGISSAVARRFGNEGFELALIARSDDNLARAVPASAKEGIVAHAFAGDLSDPTATRSLMDRIGVTVGPITIYFYNALPQIGTDASEESLQQLQSCFSVGITSFLAGLQPCVRQMRGQDEAAVLITGGGISQDTDPANESAVQSNSIGLATVKAAQHKLAGILSKRLQAEYIFVGEVMVMECVVDTPYDDGSATLTTDRIAEAFWQHYRDRGPVTVKVTSV